LWHSTLAAGAGPDGPVAATRATRTLNRMSRVEISSPPPVGRRRVDDLADRLAARFEDRVGVVDSGVQADPRGRLTAFELDALPFAVRRVFVVHDVPAGTRRGGHRHRAGVQALFCVRGRITIELRWAGRGMAVELEPDGVGLVVRAGVWSSQHYSVEGSELLVLASEPYDPASYDISVDDATRRDAP
jgi:WxcM-like, C-terminal